MQAGSIARRYARALLDIVQESAVQESSLKESDKVAQTMTDLENFEILLKNNPEFMVFLSQLSQEEATISLEDLKKELNLVE